jgi:hypothetical protein
MGPELKILINALRFNDTNKGKMPDGGAPLVKRIPPKKVQKKVGKRFVSAAVAARRPDQQMKVKTFAVCFTASVFGPLNRLVSFEDERADRESGWRACSTPPQIPNLSDAEWKAG